MAEIKYPPLEDEASAIIWVLHNFRLWNEDHQIVLHTEHEPLQCLF